MAEAKSSHQTPIVKSGKNISKQNLRSLRKLSFSFAKERTHHTELFEQLNKN